MAPSLTSMVLKAKAAPCLLLRLHWLLPRPSVLHAFGAESASHSIGAIKNEGPSALNGADRTSLIGECLTRQPLGLQTLPVFMECLLVCRVLAQGPFGLG